MEFRAHAEEVATEIINRFESGDLPAALADIFIHRSDNRPCRKWSINNQILTFFADTEDARGFRQWLEAGRAVKKGAKAFHILAPLIAKWESKDEETGETKEAARMYGLKTVPVFRIEDTEIIDAAKWEIEAAAQAHEAAHEKALIARLPLREVAESWGLSLRTFDALSRGAKGYYSHAGAIGLGTENLATWAHEMIHAAEHRLDNLTIKQGQDAGNEAVAELGGAVLLSILGMTEAADMGGAYEYIKHYADGDKGKTIRLCMTVLNRVCEAVELILTEAEKIGAYKAAA